MLLAREEAALCLPLFLLPLYSAQSPPGELELPCLAQSMTPLCLLTPCAPGT